MPQVVIVGAGISGLATAYHLQEVPELDVTVLEASDRPGGVVWTERRDGFQIELGANGFLDNKPSTLRLCEKLGLSERLVPANDAARHRYLFLDNRLQRLPEGLWSFLRTPLLSWRCKASILTERFRRPRLHSADESVHDFITRRTSAEVAEVFGDALVTGIHAGDPRLLSMAAAFPRIVEMERRHGSVLRGMTAAARERRAEAAAQGRHHRGTRLWSFREGLRLLIETLVAGLRKPPLFGVRVKRVEKSADPAVRWMVQLDGGERRAADAVVLAAPAYRQAELLADLDPVLGRLIGEIAYSPAVVVALGYHEHEVPVSLDGFGYIAPQRTRRDVLGFQWCSSIFPDRAPEGMVLLRGIAGGWHRQDLLDWDDQRLLAAVRQELKAAMGIEADPAFHHIVRWKHAIPQYHLGHLERVSRIEELAAGQPGLFLTGNAYHGVALNDCTEQAERTASRVASFLRHDPIRVTRG